MLLALCLGLALLPPAQASPDEPTAAAPAPAVVIQEFDADQPGPDRADFVELAGPPGTALDGVLLVLYDGAGDEPLAYDVIDLYGQRLDARGALVIGAPSVPRVGLVALGGDGLQNGPDGLALWYAPGAHAGAFAHRGPADAPPGARLLDAVLYGGAAPALQAALGLPADAPRLIDTGEPAFSRAAGDARPLAPDAFAAAPPSPGVLAPRIERVWPHRLQGPGHLSPERGRLVRGVEGVVTALRRDGFHLQTPEGEDDGDPRSSEAVRVVLAGSRRPVIGEHLRLSGRVQETRPGGRESDLPRTELHADAGWEVLARDVPLPAPARLGPGGRAIPDQVIDDDSPDGVVGADTPFDPERDGLDFWESLEGMRVELPYALVVGRTTPYGEIPVIVAAPDASVRGLGADGRLRALPDDPQPELLLLDDTLHPLPELLPRDRLPGAVTGVLDHDFGAFRLLVTALPEPERAAPPGPVFTRAPTGTQRLRVATYNVQNLHAGDDPARFERLAQQIVGPLGMPALLALQEIQDDSGPRDDGVTSARRTLERLTGAVRAAGGPRYEALALDPADGADGGQPGANIRVALLFDPAAGVTLTARPHDGAGTRAALRSDAAGAPRLHPNPARIEPGHSAWTASRKPLVAELEVRGRTLFVVVAHLVSRRGDPSLFDAVQPPSAPSAATRTAQAGLVAAFVDRLRAMDPAAAVLVLGDLNAFEDGPELTLLRTGGRLELLTDRVPVGARGTHVHQGRTRTLDHVLASPGLRAWGPEPRVDHLPLNTVRADGVSDHDPVLVEWFLADPERDDAARAGRR